MSTTETAPEATEKAEPTMTVELTCKADHRVVVRGVELAHGQPHTLPASSARKLIKANVAKLAAKA